MIQHLLDQQWQSLGQNQDKTAGLPTLPEEALQPLFNSDEREEFIARPVWQAACYETTAYSRQASRQLVSAVTEEFDNGLLARMVARLAELISLAQSMVSDAEELKGLANETALLPTASQQTGQGLAMIEAARGRLIHWLKLERGVVSDYAIEAPVSGSDNKNSVISVYALFQA